MSDYYRPTGPNPNWIKMFTEYDHDDWQETLDEICRLSCGIGVGVSDQCMAYARHVHVCLLAAFYLGAHLAGNENSEELKKQILNSVRDEL